MGVCVCCPRQALGDKVTAEHELLSLDKAALYCCINGLQTSSPALLQLPQLAVTEMPRGVGAGHRLEARVAALEACLLLQVRAVTPPCPALLPSQCQAHRYTGKDVA